MATPLFHLHPWRPCCGRSQVSSPTTRTGTGASSRPGCQALLVACVKGFNLVPPVFYQGRAGCHRHVADPHLTLQRCHMTSLQRRGSRSTSSPCLADATASWAYSKRIPHHGLTPLRLLA